MIHCLCFLGVDIPFIKHRLAYPASQYHPHSMRALRGCSALVIRCFKNVETFADWLTGAAGPFFVAFCWSLIVLGGIAFCESPPMSLVKSPDRASRYDREGSFMDHDDTALAHPHAGAAEPLWPVFLRSKRTSRIPLPSSSAEITP